MFRKKKGKAAAEAAASNAVEVIESNSVGFLPAIAELAVDSCRFIDEKGLGPVSMLYPPNFQPCSLVDSILKVLVKKDKDKEDVEALKESIEDATFACSEALRCLGEEGSPDFVAKVALLLLFYASDITPIPFLSVLNESLTERFSHKLFHSRDFVYVATCGIFTTVPISPKEFPEGNAYAIGIVPMNEKQTIEKMKSTKKLVWHGFTVVYHKLQDAIEGVKHVTANKIENAEGEESKEMTPVVYVISLDIDDELFVIPRIRHAAEIAPVVFSHISIAEPEMNCSTKKVKSINGVVTVSCNVTSHGRVFVDEEAPSDPHEERYAEIIEELTRTNVVDDESEAAAGAPRPGSEGKNEDEDEVTVVKPDEEEKDKAGTKEDDASKSPMLTAAVLTAQMREDCEPNDEQGSEKGSSFLGEEMSSRICDVREDDQRSESVSKGGTLTHKDLVTIVNNFIIAVDGYIDSNEEEQTEGFESSKKGLERLKELVKELIKEGGDESSRAPVCEEIKKLFQNEFIVAGALDCGFIDILRGMTLFYSTFVDVALFVSNCFELFAFRESDFNILVGRQGAIAILLMILRNMKDERNAALHAIIAMINITSEFENAKDPSIAAGVPVFIYTLQKFRDDEEFCLVVALLLQNVSPTKEVAPKIAENVDAMFDVFSKFSKNDDISTSFQRIILNISTLKELRNFLCNEAVVKWLVEQLKEKVNVVLNCQLIVQALANITAMSTSKDMVIKFDVLNLMLSLLTKYYENKDMCLYITWVLRNISFFKEVLSQMPKNLPDTIANVMEKHTDLVGLGVFCCWTVHKIIEFGNITKDQFKAILPAMIKYTKAYPDDKNIRKGTLFSVSLASNKPENLHIIWNNDIVPMLLDLNSKSLLNEDNVVSATVNIFKNLVQDKIFSKDYYIPVLDFFQSTLSTSQNPIVCRDVCDAIFTIYSKSDFTKDPNIHKFTCFGVLRSTDLFNGQSDFIKSAFTLLTAFTKDEDSFDPIMESNGINLIMSVLRIHTEVIPECMTIISRLVFSEKLAESAVKPKDLLKDEKDIIFLLELPAKGNFDDAFFLEFTKLIAALIDKRKTSSFNDWNTIIDKLICILANFHDKEEITENVCCALSSFTKRKMKNYVKKMLAANSDLVKFKGKI